jgi:hypothetical protein
MPTIDIIFGPYAPDNAMMPTTPKGPVPVMQALNVRYTGSGYCMADGPTQIASSPVTVSASSLHVTTDGDCFANSGSVLYSSSDYGETAWNDVSPASLNAISTISYTRYHDSAGDDWLVCLTDSNLPLYRDLNGSISTDWAVIPDSPPLSLRAGVVRDHLVLGHLTGEPNAVQWNSIGVIGDWPTPGSAEALAEEAGKQYLPASLGGVMAVVGLEEFGLVFQDYGITRMTYQGGNTVYAFDTFDTHRGLMTRPTPVVVGNLVYYYLRRGGFFVTDGFSVRRLDDGYHECGSAASVTHNYDIDQVYRGAFHPRHRCILWQGDGVNYDGNSRWILYNVDTGTFTHLDNENSIFDSNDIGSIAYGEDSTGRPELMTLGTVSSVTAMYSFRSRASSFVLGSGWLELSPGQYSTIHSITPLGHNFSADPNIYVQTADDYQDLTMSLLNGITNTNTTAPAYTKLGHTTASTTGDAGSGKSARFHNIRLSGSVTFDKCVGVRVEYATNGAA